MKTENVRKMVLAGLFLALGIVLPFVTGQIPQFGKRLLPMHIPVMLCGFFCGAPYGLLVGFIVPLFRSLIFTVPTMMPGAVAMAFELATYGFVTGFLYKRLKNKKFKIYISLVSAMVIGRIVWGIASFFLFQIMGNSFTWMIFVTDAVKNAVIGIGIQLIIIPMIVYQLNASTEGVYERRTSKE